MGQGAPPKRRTAVLAEDRETIVSTWRIRNVRPVSLSYSPLKAIDGAVLIETIVLAFDGVEMR